MFNRLASVNRISGSPVLFLLVLAGYGLPPTLLHDNGDPYVKGQSLHAHWAEFHYLVSLCHSSGLALTLVPAWTPSTTPYIPFRHGGPDGFVEQGKLLSPGPRFITLGTASATSQTGHLVTQLYSNLARSLAVSSAMTIPKIRKKAFSHKVRSGCDTCELPVEVAWCMLTH